ncbi:hypothetical protein [Natronoglycomyces albus]|uniref:Shikimate dehydrogenase n=1 Tax=Natronoglycomyces albus TaxID=2811108 RepID=A0A895XDK1_9ACTN|nr:hypothetical protein [Natronoglycomyces albus]QSB03881.1 hypothetical protein JQS30_08570 [Natronoglycomyces albus]
MKIAIVGSSEPPKIYEHLFRTCFSVTGVEGTCERFTVAPEDFAEFVDSLDSTWTGLSVLADLQPLAYSIATEPISQQPNVSITWALRRADTLVRSDDGWLPDHTEFLGIDAGAGRSGTAGNTHYAILGAGNAAFSALGAAWTNEAAHVEVFARTPEAIEGMRPAAERLELDLMARRWEDVWESFGAHHVISALPPGALDRVRLPWLTDVQCTDLVYDPWPTPAARAGDHAGAAVSGGYFVKAVKICVQFDRFTHGAPPKVDTLVRAFQAYFPHNDYVSWEPLISDWQAPDLNQRDR